MYTYKVKENGYEILKNGEVYIVQEEPYIPNKSISYEENAIKQIEELEDINNISNMEETTKSDLEKKIEELELILAETIEKQEKDKTEMQLVIAELLEGVI